MFKHLINNNLQCFLEQEQPKQIIFNDTSQKTL